ncbi:MAG: hypothetical protein BAX61_13255 [Psychrobacter sp. B29-1]|nr:MAG: hypothetical protein BAX61_13255 [Psychrobacter sp. B29-1]
MIMSKNSFEWRETPKENPYIAAYFPDKTIKEFTDMYEQVPELEDSQRECLSELKRRNTNTLNSFGQPLHLLGRNTDK